MKPIIIIKEIKDGKITLTKEEFEKYLDDAYEAGYADGSNSFTAKGYTWTTTDLTDPLYKAPEFTCNSSPVDNGNIVKTVTTKLD